MKPKLEKIFNETIPNLMTSQNKQKQFFQEKSYTNN